MVIPKNIKAYTFAPGTKEIKGIVCRKHNELRVVSLPDGLETIGDAAFSLCPLLKLVEIPASVKHIGVAAFCKSGVEVVTFLGIPKEIEQSVFAECKKLNRIVIPSGKKEYFAKLFPMELLQEQPNQFSHLQLSQPIQRQYHNIQKQSVTMDVNKVLKCLKEDYTLRSSLHRKNLTIQEELEKEIDDLEQSYLTSYIMPKLEVYAKDLLKDLECEAYLSIMKNVDDEIRVNNEYDFNMPKTIPEVEIDESTPLATRAGSIGFAVRFKDGATVQHRDAKDTLIESLRIIGFEKVSAFKGRLFNGYPLVGRKKRTDGNHKWQEQVGEWFVYINMSNKTKINILQMISDEFHLGLHIEMFS